MQPDGWDLSELKYVELTEKERMLWLLDRGDILFNRTNSKELVGKCEVFDEPGDWVFASYLMRLTVDTKQTSPEFVSAYLSSPSGRAQIERESRQIIGMTNINAEEIRTLRIPLPKPAVQKNLLGKLNAARKKRDAALAAADAVLDGLDGFILAQLSLALPSREPITPYAIRLRNLADGRLDPFVNRPWYAKMLKALEDADVPKRPLGDLIGPVVGGATPSRDDNSLYTLDGVPLIRINNIQPNDLRLDDCRFIADTVHENDLRRSQLVRGDILMTITGRVGTTAVYDLDTPANINQHLVRLRLKQNSVDRFYLAAFLNSSFGLGLSNRSVTGATRIALDYDSIRALPIPVPRPATQTAIATEVDRRRGEARRLRADARAGWAAACQAFEDALLGPVA